jgi:hypothetical protein
MSEQHRAELLFACGALLALPAALAGERLQSQDYPKSHYQPETPTLYAVRSDKRLRGVARWQSSAPLLVR